MTSKHGFGVKLNPNGTVDMLQKDIDSGELKTVLAPGIEEVPTDISGTKSNPNGIVEKPKRDVASLGPTDKWPTDAQKRDAMLALSTASAVDVVYWDPPGIWIVKQA